MEKDTEFIGKDFLYNYFIEVMQEPVHPQKFQYFKTDTGEIVESDEAITVTVTINKDFEGL
jgi:hypothetical protein